MISRVDIKNIITGKKTILIMSLVFSIGLMVFAVLPYIIFGENNYVTIHDNLDIDVAFAKYIRDFGYCFKLNTATATMDNLSTVFFRFNFTLNDFFYYFFPVYSAYVLVYISSILIGFFSMYYLQKIIFKDEKYNYIYLLISSLYSVLPAYHIWRIALASLPLFVILLYYIWKKNNTCCMILFFFYPFLSNFESTLVFLCGLMLLFIIGVSIYEKKINKKLVIAFFFLCLGTAMFNLRLFYMRFVVHETLSRDMLPVAAHISLKALKKYFCDYLLFGYYHAPTMQTWAIIPSFLLASVLVIFSCIRVSSSISYLNKDEVVQKNFKVTLSRDNIPYEMKVCFISGLLILIFCLVASGENAGCFVKIKKITKVLTGFSFARFFTLNRIFWFLVFTSSLIFFSKRKVLKYSIPVFILIQIIFLVISPTSHTHEYSIMYNDFAKSMARNLIPSLKKDAISWKEFYDQELFDQIKEDINYKGEQVAAVGYHPAVLMYNDFNQVDGYISVYPQAAKVKFRKLIEPELKVSKDATRYYDSWGGRRYLFCGGFTYLPTRKPHPNPVILRINTKVFREDYDGKYILSRAPISNADDLGLFLRGSWTHKNSIYTIYVYQVKGDNYAKQ